MAEKSIAIGAVCAALKSGVRNQAISLLKRDYPFVPHAPSKRQYGPLESTRVFVRDGFIDRYTSERLVFPPVLRVISAELPDEVSAYDIDRQRARRSRSGIGSGGTRGMRDLGSGGPKPACRANIVQTPKRDASIPDAQPLYRALYGSTTCHQAPPFDTSVTGFDSR
jgi:hypothetical protein